MFDMLTVCFFIGCLAFVISVIVELIKDLPGLKRIPTDIVVLVLSQIITHLAVIALVQYKELSYIWYYAVATIVAAFVVAYVSMMGWEKLMEIYKRLVSGAPKDLK